MIKEGVYDDQRIPNNIWLTSDSHFFHTNILKYCNRHFSSVEEMNEVLISTWNSVVKIQDTVYFLGDFGFGSTEELKSVFKRLNGTVDLIRGNHDGSESKMLSIGFNKVWSRLFMSYAGYNFILRHKYFSQEELPAMRSIVQLCGHRHSKKGEHVFYNEHILTYDVGVDSHDYMPVNIDTVIEELQEYKKLKITNLSKETLE